MTGCILAFTSQIKLKLTATGIFGESGQMCQGLPLMFTAIMASSFIGTLVSNPFDVLKSRMQNTKSNDGTLETLIKIVKEEGLLTLWAGFFPAFLRQAPKQIFELTWADKITMALTGKAVL
uniref:Uncharacterized protein n=1 Tax=Pseudictyota dubia TaxID=2749911 RepID=A0A7R9W2E0_9STRA